MSYPDWHSRMVGSRLLRDRCGDTPKPDLINVVSRPFGAMRLIENPNQAGLVQRACDWPCGGEVFKPGF
jgi:hypothetical protein